MPPCSYRLQICPGRSSFLRRLENPGPNDKRVRNDAIPLYPDPGTGADRYLNRAAIVKSDVVVQESRFLEIYKTTFMYTTPPLSTRQLEERMEYEIKYQPSYSMLLVHLSQGESITAEAGSMTYMDTNIQVKTRMRERGFLATLGVALFGGQSFFVNDYIAGRGAGRAAFVSAPIGDIERLQISPDHGYIVQKAGYIASTQGIDLDVKWEGFTKGLFGQGIFMIRATGNGEMFINTFGAIDRHTLGAGESLVVDNYLVAFSDTCTYRVEEFGGVKGTLLSGEGLVTRINGPGEVFIQTKNIREFVEWLWPLLAPRIQSRSQAR